MKNKKTFYLTMCAMAVAINIVLGSLVSLTKIPLLFLDTVGTIFIAVLIGPWQAAAVGTATNILTPLLSGNVKDIPFFLVNAVVGIVVGYIAKKYEFNIKTAIITGLILSIVCPLIGTPIAVWIYGGITGGGTDFFFVWLKNSGMSIFNAAFFPRIAENLIDKILSCIFVLWSMKYIPKEYRGIGKEESM
ncbi:energy-coupling factor transport system substrate-specific component [Caloramator quimbayensis]|uniref:Energy-coupling factor transport system substrate-specific component n=1 Tax=Caloramator quimbayensis TaxID=1147123 RepID=A0A1T4YEU9_9CLOT|nr:CD3073 family putative ECF transporter S component [Caloramator quimbayensis]SKB00299.1 energy-coupling factor transport system substrate-specific component [Caloramator quimbayensis]